MSALPIPAAAAALGVSVPTLKRWIGRGAPVARRGRRGRGCRTLIDPEAIRAWRAAQDADHAQVEAVLRALAGRIPELLADAVDEAFRLAPDKRGAAWTACAGLPDDTLRAYLRALEAGRRMDAGEVPPGWGEPVARTCEGCGPVLLWPGCPPKVKACPWCFRRKAGKAIPRPLVACGDCRHYLPDTVNPPAGMGGCDLGHLSRWPMQRHRCGDWRLRRPGGQSGLR